MSAVGPKQTWRNSFNSVSTGDLIPDGGKAKNSKFAGSHARGRSELEQIAFFRPLASGCDFLARARSVDSARRFLKTTLPEAALSGETRNVEPFFSSGF